MRYYRLFGWAAVLLLALAAGCSSPGGYVGNRAADLADILTAELTIGPGFDVHTQATGLLGTALGYSPQWGLMMHGRFVGRGERQSAGILISASTRIADEVMSPLYGNQVYAPRNREWFPFLRYPVFVPAFKENELARVLDIEAGASVIVGTHLGVSPIELVDFVLGLFLLDPVGDDYRPGAAPVAPPAQPGGAPAGTQSPA